MWTGFIRLRIKWIEGFFEEESENVRGLDLRSRKIWAQRRRPN